MPSSRYSHVLDEPENPFSALISNQRIAIIPSFTLESGVTMRSVQVAYKTWGRLDSSATNAMVICHALTGSADVGDWWGPLIGPGKAFDTRRFFVICCNSLGSPYGSASPVTVNPDTGRPYGPEFPLTTIRDDIKLHRLILEDLGVKQIAAVIGGSMGGMLVLEWAFVGKDFVRSIVPLATSSRHSAWCISWSEAQRQSIYVDPKYDEGYYPYDDPPATGLGAARMSALLTYRSRNSFESRFGRNIPDPSRHAYINSNQQRPTTPGGEHWVIHNDGHKSSKSKISQQPPDREEKNSNPKLGASGDRPGRSRENSNSSTASKKECAPTFFSAQTYLRYQAQKFVKRFDANCYIAITRKLDTHDVSRDRTEGDVAAALKTIEQPTLVIGIESDGLFTYAEQQELAETIPNAELATIDSPEGHDAFLLQFMEVNQHIEGFLRKVLPDIMEKEVEEPGIGHEEQAEPSDQLALPSVGEVDDITAW